MANWTARDATILTLVSQNPGGSQKVFDKLIDRTDKEKTRVLARKIRDKHLGKI